MGGGKDREQQTFLSQVPQSTCNVEERINHLQLHVFPFLTISDKVLKFLTNF